MSGERWVLLALAPARAAWFGELTRWTSSGALPAEFVKCRSADEARARLGSGRAWSALVVDTASSGLDRDLVDTAHRSGAAVLGVRTGSSLRDPPDPGFTAVLPASFGREELLDVLCLHARPISRGDRLPASLSEPAGSPWRGRMVGVCGPGGTGASTLAMALAQAMAADARHGGRVLLADLALRADQAMLHDAVELGPGLQELVDAHRLGSPDPAEVGSGTFAVPGRAYRLLLGLRAPSGWSALRPRATSATILSLRQAFSVVVADITGDLEGELDCGSADVEERNHLARTVASESDLVVAVGAAGIKGLHSLARLMRSLAGAGVGPPRLLPVVNRAPRDPRERSRLTAALAELAPGTTEVSSPLFIREARVEDCLRAARPLPSSLVRPLGTAVGAHLDRLADAPPPMAGPTPVEPGTLGSWTDAG